MWRGAYRVTYLVVCAFAVGCSGSSPAEISPGPDVTSDGGHLAVPPDDTPDGGAQDPAIGRDAGSQDSGKPDSSTCTPRTCADRGAECGASDDGCGHALQCGSCNAPDVCGASAPNRCSCAPKAIPPGTTGLCGHFANGCGDTHDYGPCSAGELCQNAGDYRVCIGVGGTTQHAAPPCQSTPPTVGSYVPVKLVGRYLTGTTSGGGYTTADYVSGSGPNYWCSNTPQYPADFPSDICSGSASSSEPYVCTANPGY